MGKINEGFQKRAAAFPMPKIPSMNRVKAMGRLCKNKASKFVRQNKKALGMGAAGATAVYAGGKALNNSQQQA